MLKCVVQGMYPENPGVWVVLHDEIGADVLKAMAYLNNLENANTDGWALGYRIDIQVLT